MVEEVYGMRMVFSCCCYACSSRDFVLLWKVCIAVVGVGKDVVAQFFRRGRMLQLQFKVEFSGVVQRGWREV